MVESGCRSLPQVGQVGVPSLFVKSDLGTDNPKATSVAYLIADRPSRGPNRRAGAITPRGGPCFELARDLSWRGAIIQRQPWDVIAVPDACFRSVLNVSLIWRWQYGSQILSLLRTVERVAVAATKSSDCRNRMWVAVWRMRISRVR